MQGRLDSNGNCCSTCRFLAGCLAQRIPAAVNLGYCSEWEIAICNENLPILCDSCSCEQGDEHGRCADYPDF
jgi:hypothetical protein